MPDFYPFSQKGCTTDEEVWEKSGAKTVVKLVVLKCVLVKLVQNVCFCSGLGGV